jgi:NADPH:quinone reductase-like Zn-dependent oxidoreductase
VYARSDNGAGKCYAEYVALNPRTVAHKPVGLSHVEAAAMPLAALTPLVGANRQDHGGRGYRGLQCRQH